MQRYRNIKDHTISLIVPLFNEEDNISIFLEKATIVLNQLNTNYEILFINDGSQDNSLEILKHSKLMYDNIRILNFSRNFGKESALSAGIDYAIGDLIIPIDIDLEHPLELIPKFIEKWIDGYEVVFAKKITKKIIFNTVLQNI